MHKLMVIGLLVGAAGVANAAAKLTIGAAVAAGGTYDAKLLTFALKRNHAALVTCYAKALVKAPELKGTATVTFTIDATGALVAVNAKGLNQEAESCIATTVSKIKVDKPKDGKPVDVTLPLTFEQVAVTADNDIQGGLIGSEGEAQGFGFGRSGYGPGGGCGTGWGTIGTGRYGTIGPGTGSGYGVGGCGGRGGMRSRTTAVPQVSIGQPTVKGNLDKAIIRRYIKRNVQKLMYCYEKQLLAKPTIKGTVTIDFTITPEGLVASSKAAGMKDTDVESCVASVVKAIEFPKPKGGGDVIVAYPLTFKPAGG